MQIKLTLTTFIIVLSCWSTQLHAQNSSAPMAGARGLAMGDASVAFTDIHSIFSNQAGIAFMEGLGFSIGAERRFLTSEINSIVGGFAYPTNAGTFGLSLNYFGFSGYNEQRIGLAYARKLSKKISLGAQVDYLGYSIPDYGNKSIFTFELGVQAQLIEELYIGAHVFNPVRQEVVPDEKVPTVFKLGAAYIPNKKLTITGELEKDIDFDFVFKAGVEYFLIDILCLRAGFSTEPILNSFGMGLKLKNGLMIDLASSYHYDLGFTPAISIAFEMNKNKGKESEETGNK